MSTMVVMAVLASLLVAFGPDAGAWTDAQNRVTFGRYVSGTWQVHTMTPDGRNVRQLTSSSGHKCDPTMSPDGATVAFTSGPSLRLVPAVGGAEVEIVNMTGEILRNPTWSPDGKAIVFMASTGHGDTANAYDYVTNLFITRHADGAWQAPVPLTAEAHVAGAPDVLGYGDGKVTSPRFSPDGTRLAFTYSPDRYWTPERDIYTMTVPAPGAPPVPSDQWVQITAIAGTEHRPTWDPTGARLLYTTSCGAWTVAAPGAVNGQLQTPSRVGSVSACEATWSSRSANEIVYESGDVIRVLNLSTGRAKVLTAKRMTDRHPDW